jgi:predicted permease
MARDQSRSDYGHPDGLVGEGMMWLYRVLLHLYPKSFRSEYGREMRSLFEHELRSATGAAVALLVARTIGDVVGNALYVHLDLLRQDVGYAARSLRRTPGFTLTAVLVSALGIGATTATFLIADHVLLRPLPFTEPDRLVKLWETRPSRGNARSEPSPPNYLDWKRRSTSFEGIETFVTGSTNLIGAGDPEVIQGARLSGGMFQLLGRQAVIGRALIESDAGNQALDAIVISDALWRLRFGADPGVLGRTVTLNDQACTIVGVMPADFHFPTRNTQLWRILRLADLGNEADRNNNILNVVARLKRGITLESARSEMELIAAQLHREYPKELADSGVTTIRWRAELAEQPRLLLIALVGSSLCLLLIACTNLANLLLARALARRGEFAIRAAVGASVDRLIRQMLTDSLVIASAGGVLGVILALASAPLVARLVPTTLPIAETPGLDLRMLLVAAVLTLGTGLFFGVMPAIRVGRLTDGSALREGFRAGTGRRTELLRSALVVAEIGASVVLLISVGLLLQSLWRVQQVDPGFKPDNVLTMRTTLPRPKYLAARRNQFYNQILDEVHALPGVTRAAYITFLPMVVRGGVQAVGINGENPEQAPGASFRILTPGFFEAVGTPLLRGRDVMWTDSSASPLVAVVSASFVRQYFPGIDPIGQQFRIASGERTIVGVVGDIRVRGLERETEPQVYLPAAQMRDGQLSFYSPQDLVIRASVPATTLVAAVRSIIQRADPEQPITNVRLLSEVVAAETAPRLTQLRVLGAFAVAAFLLAAIGIHGLLAFSVTSRSREIGVRIALGAKARDIMWMVVGRSTRLALIGVAIGGALAYAAGRWLQALLFGVSPADAGVFAAAIAIALLMTLAGSILPAWRAVRVDPMTATRAD